MLQIRNISKEYKTGNLIQSALKNVSLNFRNNEFVSILGPSGSGKTTLLNIIGGLDRYDKGNLIINNVSTKEYKDKDWDSYRNHTIGFVFQSYNLIPHQSVLSNVELALTISGISKKERRNRALEALKEVGLEKQVNKKPNQMSGGQMQRVAIARALVNNPDILLADEPTGALDSNTSIQVMELLKKVARNRLVIMVTHNPELANKYSTRIINLKDGQIQGDTNPFKINEENKNKPIYKNLGKSSMSMITALSLSLNNLMTKKGRTFLTSFAGSIGIIGIALILALSTGFKNYIDKIQEETLTSYPLTIQAETADMMSMLLSGKKDQRPKVEKYNIQEEQNVANLFTTFGRNDLKSFNKHIEKNIEEVNKMISYTRYYYSVEPNIYTKDKNNKIILLNPSDLFTRIMGGSSSNLMSGGISIFEELIDDEKKQNEEYQLIVGKMAKEYNEVMLVLPEDYIISDLLLYGIGIRDPKELETMVGKIIDGEKIENKNEPLEFTYEELMNHELKLIEATKKYKYNPDYDIYENMSDDEKYMNNLYNNATKLNIVGIVKVKGNGANPMTNSGILYTKKLTEHIIDSASKSDIVKKQLEEKNINVFSGKTFDSKDKTNNIDFKDMISIDEKAISEAIGIKINKSDIENVTNNCSKEISKAITIDTKAAQSKYLNNLSKVTKNILRKYIEENEVAGIAKIKMSKVDEIVEEKINIKENDEIFQLMEKEYIIPKDVFKKMYSGIIKEILKQYISLTTKDISKENQKINTNQENTENLDKNTDLVGILVSGKIDEIVDSIMKENYVIETSNNMAKEMTEAKMKKTVLTKVGELTGNLIQTMSKDFNVDSKKIAGAFKFNMTEEEMRRLFKSLTNTTVENANTNLISLGYQDIKEPSAVSFYFNNFEDKESFVNFINDYNENIKKENEDKVIKYSDITGLLMSSVKTIVDSVSYVLIAFVSISLVVSSIMIGIITYISVLERTKEIGILRAIGASKKNISSIFNAETFIIGLLSGLIGIAMTITILIPTNMLIHNLNEDITAVLPIQGTVVLVILSTLLTLIGGIIPAKTAAKKDPVLALRTE